ncbi:hypothetical protein LWU51_02010 [Enterobacter hormaechei]|nr:hypothetical protein [Enterobacter hormaechei]
MTNVSAVEKMAELMQQMEENSPRVAALQYCLTQVAEKVEEAEKRNAELESRCAALAAEAHGFKRFFMFAINVAFDGCDITGDQIQEVAKEIGLVRVESYSAEKHAEMSGDPSVMEEGDDFYIMNKTPATDAFQAEVRAQGVEMFAAVLRCKGDDAFFDAIAEAQANAADQFAAQLRKGVQS